ncbi:MAG TPA: glucose-6-phosphate dehydrogenase [Candidatus Paceibacterota bacterium]
MTPTIFIILGITGDLSGRKLLPSLLNLYVKKHLPPKFAIVGFSRRTFTREEFREYIRGHMKVEPGQYHEEDIKHFLDHMYYEQGFFDMPDSYGNLASRLKTIDDGFHQCSNKLFHLAVAPHFYETILEHLSNSGLTIPCGGNEGWTRVLVEKPFGHNIETATKLDKRLGELFSEEQIFRIDHYLAKEALQNIMAFRFTNTLFEPLWNSNHVSAVHIKLLERNGIEGRGGFYDDIGALKDVGQNHILQMLALVAMEPPENFDAISIRKQRAKLLGNIKPVISKGLADILVRGQYEGYVNEKGVKRNSRTETYFRVETYIDCPRWKGVPFYLESGKALSESKSEIDIYFKSGETFKSKLKNRIGDKYNIETKSENGNDSGKLIRDEDNKKNDEEIEHDLQNILTFRIQPNEGIKIRFFVKTPGFGMKVEPKTLKFKYSDSPSFQELPDAYERVLYDAIVGDQTLFTSTDEVLRAWKFITSIVTAWDSLPLVIYKKGSESVV